MKTRFGTIFQQDFSLLTGEERANPMNPTRRKANTNGRSFVSVGGRKVKVERPRHWTSEELNKDTIDWNAAKRRRGHECAAMEMGQACTHYVAPME